MARVRDGRARRGLQVGVAGLILAALPVADAAAWWNSSWRLRRKVRFDNSAQAENLTGFPVLVRLDSTRIEYFRTQGAGQDIRFVDADDTTVLAHEIEAWNPAGSSYVWVRVPQVDASSSADYMWMYYDNSTAPDGQNAAGVWTSGFEGVWHMGEGPTGAAPQMLDSTGHGHHGTCGDDVGLPTSQWLASQQVPGLVGGSLDFNGVGNYVSGTIGAVPAEYTLEAWVNRTRTDQLEDHILAPTNVQFMFDNGTGCVNRLRAGTGFEFASCGTTNTVAGTWYYTALVMRATGWTIYVDGVQDAAGPETTPSPGPDFFMSTVYSFIGGHFPGRIDEPRFSFVARSQAWLAAQNLSTRDQFLSFAPVEAPCCQALATTPGVGAYTVSAAGSFEMTFDLTTGGGIKTFYDLETDPGRATDLAGGTAFQEALFSHEIFSPATGLENYHLSAKDGGARLDVLEATQTRVRLRSESPFRRWDTNVPLAGVKGIGDYTILPPGRMAQRWERRTTLAVDYSFEQLQMTVRWDSTNPPYNAWAGYTQAGPISYSGGLGAAGADWVLHRGEQAPLRTDFLWALSGDWPLATNTFGGNDAAEFWAENSWINNTDGTLAAGTTNTWNSLVAFKPTVFVDQADAAVTARSADYRTPDALTIATGSAWNDADENTAADNFNEAESAYVVDFEPAAGLTFDLDGSVASPRFNPFFKIRRWRSLAPPNAVTLEGAPLRRSVDYLASVKPVSDAAFADPVLFHTTLQDLAAVMSPDIGTGVGASEASMTYAAGRYGQGAQFDSAADYVSIPVQTGMVSNIEFDRGRIEFWYKPNSAHTDNAQHYLFDIDSDDVDYNSSRIRIKKESDTSCVGCPNALTAEVADVVGSARGVTILATSYSWGPGEWVHLAIEWDSTDPTDNIRAYLNGVQLVPTAVPNGTFTMSAEATTGVIRIGNKAVSPGFWTADGIIDEFTIYGAATTPTKLARGGLVGSAGESLASASLNQPFPFVVVNGSGQGQYLYVGSDSKFRGLNLGLATRGAGTADLQWQFWSGMAWTSLETVAGFADTSNSLTRTGYVYWSADPASWTPYSVNGGPDLYFVRAFLASGAYTTTPVEGIFTTDMLLFQYCGNITAAAQTFSFPPPGPTAVKLMSFRALPGDGSVTLEWQTGSELDNLGFHVYRGLSADGPWTRLTSALIPGLGSSPVGQAYSWLDTGLVNGTRYYYRLEDVDTASVSTFHGPVVSVPSAPGEDGEGGGGADGTEREDPSISSCPSWVLSAAPDAVSPVCTRHGDPESVSLHVLSHDASSATLELHTGGFWALHDASGTVRVFVRGLELPSDPKAAALPVRRALVEAVVGKQVQLVSAEAMDLRAFRGLRPAVVGAPEMAVGRDGTVRPRRRALAPPLLSRGLVPAGVARLAGTVFQGERKSAVVEVVPVRHDGSRGELILAGRVRVQLAFSGVMEGEIGTGSRGRALARGRALFGEVLARLHTRGRGLYAVRYEELFPERARGFSTSFLRLQRQGEAVRFHVEPPGPVFGRGSVLYFYADRAASSTDYSSEVAIELVRQSGLAMGTAPAQPRGERVVSPSTGLASFETNRIYQPGLLEAPDVWLWEGMASGVQRTKAFTLRGLDPSFTGTARLAVRLQGGSESGAAADHHVRVSVNGAEVGEATFAGKRAYEVEATALASVLREGSNELGVVNVGDTGVSSLVFLDRFEVGYPQVSAVRGGVFEGEWAESGTAEVGGLAGPPVVVDVTAAARWLTGLERTPGAVRFQVEAGHRYVVVSPEGVLSPRVGRVAPSTLRETSNQADSLVIAPREFLGAAGPLVERRRGEGLASRAVAFEEIVSEFGHGQPSGEAIREFLAYAYHSWRKPSPRYVLLLGDSSYDPRQFQATSWASVLPALWARTSYLWTVSDPLLGAVNGEDPLPDLAIGRLPARTVEEAEGLVQKLLAWEESGQGLGGNAVLVADDPDAGGDFEADVEDIRASFLSGRPTATLKVGELGAQTRPAILAAFDEGASLVSYVGHGGAAVWASENVLNSWDVSSLRAQSRQPFVLTMNCLNGYFVASNFDSLSEALVKVGGRGAVAAFSPSGLSLDGPAHEYQRAVVGELVSGAHERLGDAILAAQRDYAESGLTPELLEVYQLLGDPATRIR